MKSTRLRLLDYLRAHPDSTAADLAHGLRLTHADVRYHLNMLLAEGVVVETGRRIRGRGRPARTLRLASAVNPQRLDLLAKALLAENLAGISRAEKDAFLRRISSRLAELAQPSGRRGKSNSSRLQSLATRLVDCVARLNDLGYRARWEAHADSPRLILEHCPFSTLYPEHPDLERLDAILLETLLGTPVRLLPVQEKGFGDVHAVFAIVDRQQG
jgi:predicted ArsR family transcriptional regulator